jgi:hypothetical protein
LKTEVRTFVLGAGASFHVGYPLTTKLGVELIEWIARNPRDRIHWIDAAEIRALFPSLANFEEIISELENPSPGSKIEGLPKWKRGSLLAGIREGLCEYFDAIKSNAAPLYCQLAERVLSPGDTMVTFNYDVSLEAELRKVGKWDIGNGYGFLLGDGITPQSSVQVLKLHGSTSWIDILFDGARGGDYGAVGADGALGARPLILPQYFEFFGYPREVRDPRFRGGGSSRAGSMILPARTKVFEARSPFWDHLWSQAASALSKATEIAIIGYSLAPTDERARELVLGAANKIASVSICCGGDNARITQEFADAGFSSVESSSNYFEDWLTALKDTD